ncbi:hypothetical protein GGS24DRAFT_32154 [Hypoxylon argillaceum]|nr:hypothetical protein GGS24DRAFT_32154 [Hypoxylon argillaceum]
MHSCFRLLASCSRGIPCLVAFIITSLMSLLETCVMAISATRYVAFFEAFKLETRSWHLFHLVYELLLGLCYRRVQNRIVMQTLGFRFVVLCFGISCLDAGPVFDLFLQI